MTLSQSDPTPILTTHYPKIHVTINQLSVHNSPAALKQHQNPQSLALRPNIQLHYSSIY